MFHPFRQGGGFVGAFRYMFHPFRNGREDFAFPLETSVRPTYDLLGVAEPDKKLALTDAGHIPPRLPVIRETLDWLDRHLGPVRPQAQTSP